MCVAVNVVSLSKRCKSKESFDLRVCETSRADFFSNAPTTHLDALSDLVILDLSPWDSVPGVVEE